MILSATPNQTEKLKEKYSPIIPILIVILIKGEWYF